MSDHEQKLLADLPEMLCLESHVRLHAHAFLDVVEVFVESLIIDAKGDFAEQLYEAAVGVVGKSLVTGLLDQARERFVVEPEVQYRVHHAGHR